MVLVRKSKYEKLEKELKEAKKLLKEVVEDNNFCYLNTNLMNKLIRNFVGYRPTG